MSAQPFYHVKEHIYEFWGLGHGIVGRMVTVLTRGE
jgi:hypothetical protein